MYAAAEAESEAAKEEEAEPEDYEFTAYLERNGDLWGFSWRGDAWEVGMRVVDGYQEGSAIDKWNSKMQKMCMKSDCILQGDELVEVNGLEGSAIGPELKTGRGNLTFRRTKRRRRLSQRLSVLLFKSRLTRIVKGQIPEMLQIWSTSAKSEGAMLLPEGFVRDDAAASVEEPLKTPVSSPRGADEASKDREEAEVAES